MRARMKVWPVRIQPPPLAFDDYPGLAPVTNELLGGALQRDPSDRVRSFGQLNRERFQTHRHWFNLIATGGRVIGHDVRHAEPRVKLVNTGVINLNGTGLVIDQDIVPHFGAPAAVASLHGGPSRIAHQHRIVADYIMVATP